MQPYNTKASRSISPRTDETIETSVPIYAACSLPISRVGTGEKGKPEPYPPPPPPQTVQHACAREWYVFLQRLHQKRTRRDNVEFEAPCMIPVTTSEPQARRIDSQRRRRASTHYVHTYAATKSSRRVGVTGKRIPSQADRSTRTWTDRSVARAGVPFRRRHDVHRPRMSETARDAREIQIDRYGFKTSQLLAD